MNHIKKDQQLKLILLVINVLLLQLIRGQKLLSVKREVHYLNADSFKFDNNCNGACTRAGGFQVSDLCSCRCHNDEAFSVTDNHCIISGPEDSFVLSDESDSKSISNKISKVAISQLRNGVILRYCEQGCKTLLHSCTINEEKSMYDNIKWTRIWPAGYEVDFGIVTDNNLQRVKLIRGDGRRYTGKLLRLNIKCTDSSNNNSIKAFAMVAVQGSFVVPATFTTSTIATANHGSTTQVTAVETSTEHVHVTTTKKSLDHQITNVVSTKPVTTNKGSTEFVVQSNQNSTDYTGLIVGVIILILSIIIAMVMLCIYIKWRRDKVQFLISFHENKIVQWVTIKWDVAFKRQEHEREKGFYVNSNSSSVSKSSSISKDDFHGMQVYKDPDAIEPKVSDLEANNEPAYVSSPRVRESRRGTIGGKIGSLYATLNRYISRKDTSSPKQKKVRHCSFSAFPKDLYHAPGEVITQESNNVILGANPNNQVYQSQSNLETENQNEEIHYQSDNKMSTDNKNLEKILESSDEENLDDIEMLDEVIATARQEDKRSKQLTLKKLKEKPNDIYCCPVGYVNMNSPEDDTTLPLTPPYSSSNCFMTELENAEYLPPYPELTESITEDPVYYSADESFDSNKNHFLDANDNSQYLLPEEIQITNCHVKYSENEEEPIYFNPQDKQIGIYDEKNNSLTEDHVYFHPDERSDHIYLHPDENQDHVYLHPDEHPDHVYLNPDENTKSGDGETDDIGYLVPEEKQNETKKNFKSFSKTRNQNNQIIYAEVTVVEDDGNDPPYKNSNRHISPSKYIIPEVKSKYDP